MARRVGARPRPPRPRTGLWASPVTLYDLGVAAALVVVLATWSSPRAVIASASRELHSLFWLQLVGVAAAIAVGPRLWDLEERGHRTAFQVVFALGAAVTILPAMDHVGGLASARDSMPLAGVPWLGTSAAAGFFLILIKVNGLPFNRRYAYGLAGIAAAGVVALAVTAALPLHPGRPTPGRLQRLLPAERPPPPAGPAERAP